MVLTNVRRALRDDLAQAKHHATFLAARLRQSVFEQYASIQDVLEELGSDSEERYAQREALTRAMLAEHRREPGGFWLSALILAYMPMMLRLRRRLCGDTFPRDECDQLVLAAFVEAVARFSLERRRDRAAMYLRQDTTRAVFRCLRKEQRLRTRSFSFVDEDAPSDVAVFARSGSRELEDDEREEVIQMFRLHCAEYVSAAKLELVVETRLSGRTLREYVDRRYGELDDRERNAVYERLKRQRWRTLRKLRSVLIELCAPPYPA